MIDKGFSLIEVLVALACSTFVLIGVSKLYLHLVDVEGDQMELFWIQERRYEIENYLKNNSSWVSLVQLNPNMNCFENSVDGCKAYKNQQPLKFNLGSFLMDGSNKNLGLNSKGDFCFEFDEIEGNNKCPIGIRPTWESVCLSPDCYEAQPKIEVQFLYRSKGASVQRNLKPFDIIFYKNTVLQSKSDICVSLGGTLVTGNCQIPALTETCSPDASTGTASFPLGFDDKGKVICGMPNVKTCVGDEILAGFDINGDVVCSPKCGN